jgi:hypothetical protein
MMQSKLSRACQPGENPAEVCLFGLLQVGNFLLLGSQTARALAVTVNLSRVPSGTVQQEIAHFPKFNSMPDAPSGVKDGPSNLRLRD